MGKPTAADLKLGLATAPVLYAARKYPELNALIMRRFSKAGDIERTRELVAKVVMVLLSLDVWFISTFFFSSFGHFMLHISNISTCFENSYFQTVFLYMVTVNCNCTSFLNELIYSEKNSQSNNLYLLNQILLRIKTLIWNLDFIPILFFWFVFLLTSYFSVICYSQSFCYIHVFITVRYLKQNIYVFVSNIFRAMV